MSIRLFSFPNVGVRKLNPTYRAGETAAAQQATAIGRAIDAQKIKEACFGAETLVHGRLTEETLAVAGPFARLAKGHTIASDVPANFEICYLRPGIEVLSRCEKTGEIAYKRITKVFMHESQEVFNIEYYCGLLDRNMRVMATGNHPFWVTGKGWVNVIDLKEGDQFENFDGSSAKFIELEKLWYRNPVYNIEVEDFHTYFVAGGILVHNKNKEISSVRPLNESKFPNAEAQKGWEQTAKGL
ncbi:MAG: HINT domain-containing protein [Betaproteobacteria bacterium]|nr:HINT domain-containing protein [Betaproteobacteria bacterium]